MPSTPSHKGATCSKCKGPLEDAVTAACGHAFCRLCLPPPSQMGAQPSGRVLLCALCEEKEPRETLLVPVPLGPLGETYCEEHGEKIYFFCENDAEFLCVFCREGPSHQAHVVGFLDEAIQPYRVRGVGSARAIWGRTVSRGGEGDGAESSRKSHGWIWSWSISGDQPQAAGTWGSPRLSETWFLPFGCVAIHSLGELQLQP